MRISDEAKNEHEKRVARKRITPFANALYALDTTDDLFIYWINIYLHTRLKV